MTHSDELYFSRLGRRVTSYTTRDAKEIAKLLVIETSIDFLKYE